MPLIVSTLHLSTRTQNKCSVQAPGEYNFEGLNLEVFPLSGRY